MPAVQVRDFPQAIYDQIKAEAAANHRSITQQTKHIVMEHFLACEESRAEPAGTVVIPEAIASGQAARQRAERRAKLFARIDSRGYGSQIASGSIRGIVREMRDER